MNKYLLIISASDLLTRFPDVDVVNRFIKEGNNVCMVFHSKDCEYYRHAMANKCFTTAIFADLNKKDDMYKQLESLSLEQFDGVWSPHDCKQLIVAQLAKRLEIDHWNDPKCYELAQNKYLARKTLTEAGLHSIRAIHVGNEDDIENKVQEWGTDFPAIVKPTSGAGSLSVYKVINDEELRAALKRVRCDFVNDSYLKTAGSKNGIIIESFVVPIKYGASGWIAEFDVDLLLYRGELKYGNVVDNSTTLPPYFQDLGDNLPSIIPFTVQRDLIQYCFKSVRALGFHVGAFHVEAWMTDKGPLLIECNPRVGGGLITKMHQDVFGVDLGYEFLLTSVNIQINPQSFEKPRKSVGYLSFTSPKSGTYVGNKSSWIQSICNSISSVEECKKQGENVAGADIGVPEFVVCIEFSHADPLYNISNDIEMVNGYLISHVDEFIIDFHQIIT